MIIKINFLVKRRRKKRLFFCRWLTIKSNNEERNRRQKLEAMTTAWKFRSFVRYQMVEIGGKFV